jgi:hypothetical protein
VPAPAGPSRPMSSAPLTRPSKVARRECLRAILALGSVALGPGCRSAPAKVPVEPSPPTTEPVAFSFPSMDGEVVNSDTTHGRVTVLVFITTFDLVSQLVVRRVGEVIVRFRPRANAAAVVVEAPQYAELLSAYRESLSLPYPVVMADFATQQGSGPFGDITKVPTTIVLDRDGGEVWRHQGPLEPDEIEGVLRRASQRVAAR